MNPIVVMLGPTAVGKTATAMGLQDYFGGPQQAQLISVDSAMVYRGMDIGTAKPSVAEQTAYPHALIDLCDPGETYTIADFVRDADVAVHQARERGQIPILVGGSMLYAKSFITGIAQLPQADPELRAQLLEEFNTDGAVHLHAELARIDPAAAANIEPNNQQRLLRALEVVRLSGRPISELWQEQQGASAIERLGGEIHTLSLEPTERTWLHQNIARRFAQMIDDGLLEEVAALMARADLNLQLPAMRAVGYRQAWMHLAGELSHEQFIQDAMTATRRLAKRQLTWLRNWPGLVKFEQTPTDGALGGVIQYLEKHVSDRR